VIDFAKCTGCGMCMAKCPAGCINAPVPIAKAV
jgi:Pyruvate/2-oxoacid:ferredoxin oxidoreductase delta subunit